jgi:hypothetical protein
MISQLKSPSRLYSDMLTSTNESQMVCLALVSYHSELAESSTISTTEIHLIILGTQKFNVEKTF